MLQPLSPVTTLPVATKSSSQLTVRKTHKSTFDAQLQRQFQVTPPWHRNRSNVTLEKSCSPKMSKLTKALLNIISLFL
jgi:hypothetical protein